MATALMDLPTPQARKHLRLGPLELVVEPGVAPELISAWLPRGGANSDDDLPLAAMAVRLDARPAEPFEAPRFVQGRVRGWFAPDAATGTLLAPRGHARLDLVSRLARVTPGPDATDAQDLLAISAAIVLARGGTALLNASAVADPTGSCWLVLGDAAARTRITQAFCADGGAFVSDDRVILRRLPLIREQLVVDAWGPAPSKGPCSQVLPIRWQPVSSLRGVLICAAGDRAARPEWKSASRDAVGRALRRADPLGGTDTGADERHAELMRLCMSRPAFYAPVPGGDPAAARAVLRLSRALEDQN
jgi:hypothetical protein